MWCYLKTKFINIKNKIKDFVDAGIEFVGTGLTHAKHGIQNLWASVTTDCTEPHVSPKLPEQQPEISHMSTHTKANSFIYPNGDDVIGEENFLKKALEMGINNIQRHKRDNDFLLHSDDPIREENEVKKSLNADSRLLSHESSQSLFVHGDDPVWEENVREKIENTDAQRYSDFLNRVKNTFTPPNKPPKLLPVWECSKTPSMMRLKSAQCVDALIEASSTFYSDTSNKPAYPCFYPIPQSNMLAASLSLS